MERFKILKTDPECAARAAVLQTRRGAVNTQVFMPVATQGTVKAVSQRDLAEIGTECMLSNTYHLYLRPGLKTLEHFGGLNAFMNHNIPVLTDSGGFQVYSLSKLRKVTENGVHFSSHIDGSPHYFTPEKVIDFQNSIGSAIWTCLDVCVKNPATRKDAAEALKKTMNWAKRAKVRFTEVTEGIEEEKRPLLFGIVQGSIYPDLRAEAARHMADLNPDGFAIGGLSVGESKEQMLEALAAALEHLPKNKPVYFMGLGTPEDLWDCAEIGVDMRTFPKMPFGELANVSINETLSRTIITSLTVFMVVLILFLFGGDVINNFAFTMLIGTISGTYSTLGIAVTLVYQWAVSGKKK